MRRLAALLLLAPFAACGGGAGLNDPTALADALRERTTKRIAETPELKATGVTVKSVTCVEGQHDREYRCSGRLTNGRAFTGPVTVSADGSRYVAEMN